MTGNSSPRFVILAEGAFGPLSSKTANACIRYLGDRVVAVIDSQRAGRTSQDVLGFGGAIPVVASFDETRALGATAMLVGIAPVGGKLPPAFREIVKAAIDHGLSIWSGLHSFVGDDQELARLARERGVEIHDLRKPPADLVVAAGRVRDVDATVVLSVGSDCNIGKMTAQLQVRDALVRRGSRVAFAATGQTGILIEGWGIAVDAVIADFIAGAAERLVLQAATNADIVLVEGQGSVIHPGYSGVTYGLIHGSMPHAFLLCVQPTRTAISEAAWVRIPPLRELVELHERIVRDIRPAPVIAISLYTHDLDERAARDAIARAQDETGLPATDPVRFDPAPIAEAIERFDQQRRA